MKDYELRDGRIWCLKHDRRWKDCDCPGQFCIVLTVTKEALDAVKGDMHAFQKALDSALQ
jgi:hypothetical protein